MVRHVWNSCAFVVCFNRFKNKEARIVPVCIFAFWHAQIRVPKISEEYSKQDASLM